MKTASHLISTRNIFWAAVALYCIVMVGLIVKARQLHGSQTPPLVIESVEVKPLTDGQVEIQLTGTGFNNDLRALLLPRLATGEPLTRKLLTDYHLDAILLDDKKNLVVANGNNLLRMTATEKGHFDLADSIVLPEKVTAMARVGEYILVGMKNYAGLALIRDSRDANFELVDYFEHLGYITDIAVADGVIYLTDMYNGLLVGRLRGQSFEARQIEAPRSAWRVIRSGRKLAVCGLEDELWLYRLDSRGEPQVVARHTLEGQIRTMHMTAQRLFVGLEDSTIVTYSLAHWPELDLQARYAMPGRMMHMDLGPEQRYLMVSLSGQGLVVIDLSAAREDYSRLLVPRTFFDFLVHQGQVYCASRFGLEVVDFARLLQVSGRRHGLHLSGPAFRTVFWNREPFRFSGSRLHRLDVDTAPAGPVQQEWLPVAWNDGLRLYRWNRGEPVETDFVEMAGGVASAEYRDGRVFALNRNGLHAFQVGTSGQLVRLGQLSLNDRLSGVSWTQNGYLAVAAGKEGLVIVDVSDPGQMVAVSQVSIPDHHKNFALAKAVVTAGDRAYLACGRGGLRIVDLADPLHPVMEQVLSSGGFAFDLDVMGDLLLVANNVNGVQVVDLGLVPAAIAGRIETPIRVQNVDLDADRMAVMGYPGGLLLSERPERLERPSVVGNHHCRIRGGKDLLSGETELVLYDGRSSVVVPLAGKAF